MAKESAKEKFIIEPHFRLQEWVAEEKGYFKDEGLDVLIDVLGRSAGPDEGLEPRLDLGQDTAGRAHVLELPGGLQQDHRVTACPTAARMASATRSTGPSPFTWARSLRAR